MNIFITQKIGSYEISTSIDLDCSDASEVEFAREVIGSEAMKPDATVINNVTCT